MIGFNNVDKIETQVVQFTVMSVSIWLDLSTRHLVSANLFRRCHRCTFSKARSNAGDRRMACQRHINVSFVVASEQLQLISNNNYCYCSVTLIQITFQDIQF